MTNKTAIGNIIDQINKVKPLSDSSTNEKNIIYNIHNKVVSISPDKIYNWKYNDRPESELGNIESLSEDIKINGQQQPCIVRKSPSKEGFFELIAGERRWRAVKLINSNLKVIIHNISDQEAALIQISENSNRENLSDYAKGLNYATLLTNQVISQKDLANRLGKSKQQISSYLSYDKISPVINSAIKDYKLVTARTAETIKQLSSLGQKYVDIILELSDRIREGKIGHTKLRELVTKKADCQNTTRISIKKYSNTGLYLFSLNKYNNRCSITFSKTLLKQLDEEENTYNKIADILGKYLKEEINKQESS